MARILVTGVSGFIGAHVARSLHADGHDITATGRDIGRLRASSRPGMQVMAADLATHPLEALVASHDAVVHCAAMSTPWGRRKDFFAANVVATERLVAASQRAGVRRFVFLSSPSIYFRMHDQLDLTESFTPPRKWITHYSESKWVAEQCVRAGCAKGMSAVILRPRAVFGEGDQAIFPRLIARARKGWFPMVDGGGALIDVTHIDSVVQAVKCSLRAEIARDACCFNITNGGPMRVHELLGLLFGSLRIQVRYVSLPRPLAMSLAGVIEGVATVWPGHPEPAISRYTLGVLAYSQTLDIAAARSVLGYAPQMGVADGIERFATWWTALDRH
ncbi:MAG TPA: NAD(P)-dependent oxidoreductase [Xanthomonadaceae bacterium]|jgi:nucleoside-diphosphate-sugar epimerase|nr:NAD(P)-dependent oxidoreductase [Xanthomonadaceae bacterium]